MNKQYCHYKLVLLVQLSSSVGCFKDVLVHIREMTFRLMREGPLDQGVPNQVIPDNPISGKQPSES